MRSLVLLAVTLFGVFATGSTAGSSERPNFLVLIADDLGGDDSGPYGNPNVRTPNLDRLAREGLRFDAAFLTCSSCSPSRASILTSRYPHNTGAEQLHKPLPKSQTLVSEPLRDAGYHTAAVGKWHLGPAAKPKFDVVKEGNVDAMVPTLVERPKDKPFFLWYAFIDPHRPYQNGTIDQPHTEGDAVIPPYLPDTPGVRRDFAQYYDEITRMDAEIGNVLDELDRQDLAKSTVVMFLSDNGRPFPRCKTTVYDSGLRTPLIVRCPGQVPAGTASDALVSSIDIAATICELAGATPPESFQGRSFARVLKDPDSGHRDAVFAEHNWHDYEARERAVRTANFKYIRNDYPDLPGTPPADAVRSPTYDEMKRLHAAGTLPPRQSGPFEAPRPPEELYALTSDPHELRNVVSDPAYASPLAELRGRLDDWRRETGDQRPDERRPDGFDRRTGKPLK